MITPPAEGVLLEDRHFNLKDIDRVAAALLEHAEGKLKRLRQVAERLEERIRAQAEASRRRIATALELTDKLIADRIDETTQQARRILEERHHAGYEEGHRNGFRKGYEEGLAIGLKEGRAHGQQVARSEEEARFQQATFSARAALSDLSKKLEKRWREHFEGADEEVMQLARAIAEQIIRAEVRAVPELLQQKLRDAIDRVGARHRLRVEVHPEDHATVSRYLRGLVAELEENAAIDIVVAPEIDRGGCRVRGADSTVDLTVETQLEIIDRRLSEARGTS